MQPTAITVRSAQTVPHPTSDYASTSSSVEITVLLEEGENVAVSVKKLQTQANNLVEQDLESKRQRVQAAKPQAATEQKAAALAEKHGGK